MLHLNKSRLQKRVPIKLQIQKVGSYKILTKYGANTYKVDLPSDLNISPIFNVAYLTKFKGSLTKVDMNKNEVVKDVASNVLPPGWNQR